MKQAKVNVVSKLTKHASMLDKKKGNDKQLEKNARKLQRLKEEIQIAKVSGVFSLDLVVRYTCKLCAAATITYLVFSLTPYILSVLVNACMA